MTILLEYNINSGSVYARSNILRTACKEKNEYQSTHNYFPKDMANV